MLEDSEAAPVMLFGEAVADAKLVTDTALAVTVSDCVLDPLRVAAITLIAVLGLAVAFLEAVGV